MLLESRGGCGGGEGRLPLMTTMPRGATSRRGERTAATDIVAAGTGASMRRRERSSNSGSRIESLTGRRWIHRARSTCATSSSRGIGDAAIVSRKGRVGRGHRRRCRRELAVVAQGRRRGGGGRGGRQVCGQMHAVSRSNGRTNSDRHRGCRVQLQWRPAALQSSAAGAAVAGADDVAHSQPVRVRVSAPGCREKFVLFHEVELGRGDLRVELRLVQQERPGPNWVEERRRERTRSGSGGKAEGGSNSSSSSSSRRRR